MKTRQKYLLVSSFFWMFSAGFLVVSLGAVSPFLIDAYGLTAGQFGIMVSSSLVGGFIFAAFSGVLIGKLGRKRTLTCVAILSALGFLGMSTIEVLPLLYVASFFAGAGSATHSIIAMSVITEIKSPFYTVMAQVFYPIGAFMSPIIAIMFSDISWKMPLITCAGILILSLVICWAVDLHNAQISNDAISSTQKNEPFFKQPIFIISSALLFLYVGTESALSNWSVAYLRDIDRLSVSQAQLVLSLIWIMLAVGRIGAAFFASNIKPHKILLADGVFMVICFSALLFFTSSDTSAFVILIIFGLSMSTAFPNIILNANRYISVSPNALAAIMTCSSVGAFTIPYITGIVAEQFNIAMGVNTLMVCAVLFLLLTAINYMLHKRES